MLSAIFNAKHEGIINPNYKLAKEYEDMLCEGIATYGKGTIMYNFYFIFQRIVLASALVFSTDYPLIQFCILIPMSMYRISYLIKYMPF